jgi:hypothetical protein
MQSLDHHAFIQAERPQPMPLTFGNRIPIDRGYLHQLVQGELIKLHTSFLQPIRNNIKPRMQRVRI